MNHEDLNQIQRLLEEHGYQVRMGYSGRCMFGKHCFGVVVESAGELFSIGQLLCDYEMRSPTIDQMGLGLIAYWPSLNTEDLLGT